VHRRTVERPAPRRQVPENGPGGSGLGQQDQGVLPPAPLQGRIPDSGIRPRSDERHQRRPPMNPPKPHPNQNRAVGRGSAEPPPPDRGCAPPLPVRHSVPREGGSPSCRGASRSTVVESPGDRVNMNTTPGRAGTPLPAARIAVERLPSPDRGTAPASRRLVPPKLPSEGGSTSIETQRPPSP
jgi:hypothetical protein